jgi:hypothetical protein
MMHRTKTMGVAFVAALALATMGALAASAAELRSGSATGTTHLTGDQLIGATFETPAGSMSCADITGHGTYTGTTASTGTATNVAFSGCTAFGLTAHVDTMGCDYLVTGSTATQGIVHIVCPTTAGGVTDEITITPTSGGAAICHINVPEQTITGNVNPGSATAGGIPDDITISVPATSKVTYKVVRTAGGAKCPTEGHHADGEYTGSITVTAFQNALHTERVGVTYT